MEIDAVGYLPNISRRVRVRFLFRDDSVSRVVDGDA